MGGVIPSRSQGPWWSRAGSHHPGPGPCGSPPPVVQRRSDHPEAPATRSSMTPYPRDVEQMMRSFYRSLREHDRRRYAAVEAAKLGHGGTEYIAAVLGIDPKTIRHGRRDLDDLPERPSPRVRQVGGGRRPKLEHDPRI